MRNTNRELKYLNIDYSQFKDRPNDEDSRDTYAGIEKGYEKFYSDSNLSESDMYQQQVIRKSKARKRIDNSSDTDSENIVVKSKKGRPRKVPRLDSSDSDLERKLKKKRHRQRFQKVPVSSSESDTDSQDSRTDSLGSDGFKKNSKNISKKTLMKRPKKVS